MMINYNGMCNGWFVYVPEYDIRECGTYPNELLDVWITPGKKAVRGYSLTRMDRLSMSCQYTNGQHLSNTDEEERYEADY